ncbi:MAG: alpha/beta fold hydrolase [Frankia sp.]
MDLGPAPSAIAGPASGSSAGPADFLLVHGTGTTSRIWSGVRTALGEARVAVPDRPSTGRLEAEVDALRAYAGPGVVLGGVSGGATLGLAMVAAGVPLAAAVLHEPAVGSLVPGLLAPVAAAWAEGGLAAFGRTLYGSTWDVSDGPRDPAAVERDLAMFLEFEPAAPAPGAAVRITITVGENSPPVRHQAAQRLRDRFGFSVAVIPGAGHAVHREQPERFAALLRPLAVR